MTDEEFQQTMDDLTRTTRWVRFAALFIWTCAFVEIGVLIGVLIGMLVR